MAYNKKAHLKNNIEAIKLAFTLEHGRRTATAEEQAVLRSYSGFGGIKAILNPASSLLDAARWTKSDLELFPLVSQLHSAIRNHATDEAEYKRYFSSLKNSILTAFYTPQDIVSVLASELGNHGITPSRFLDPSGGTGVFVDAFQQQISEQKLPQAEVVSYEKDLLTGKILSQLHPEVKVEITGFEDSGLRHFNRFDMTASNIPFGDIAVFDPSFNRSKEPARQQAAKNIHNYFFLKGLDSLRDGGILAYITSQGVLNSPANEEIRSQLMRHSRLVSAIRLPNNLFSDGAGTDVGSDLIILQKEYAREAPLTTEEQAFITSIKGANGIYENNYITRTQSIIQTKAHVDTDPYGHPGMVYTHEGGIPGMVADLRKILSNDFSRNLNISFYQQFLPSEEHRKKAQMSDALTMSEKAETIVSKPDVTVSEPPSIVESEPVASEAKVSPAIEMGTELSLASTPVLSLYDLFEFTAEERTQLKPSRRKNRKVAGNKQPVQGNLFGEPLDATVQLNKVKGKSKQKAYITPTVFDAMHGNYKKPERKEVSNAYPVVDARQEEKRQLARIEEEKVKEAARIATEEARRQRMQSRPYQSEVHTHYKEGTLVTDNSQIGYLRSVESNPTFHPLELPDRQLRKATLYTEIRDSYRRLYKDEAERREENIEERTMLNRLYDDFIRQFGNLNDAKNVDLFRMDNDNREILSLERFKDGKALKADIFDHPVAFNKNEITHVDTSDEALSASLNRYGEVNMEYMTGLTDKTESMLLDELKGRVFFNPLLKNYEIADKFIAGNVISKAELIEEYVQKHPDDEAAKESLAALKEAKPRSIPFEDLDFNFGERWLNTGIYSKYASYLFDTDVKITYAASRDEFSVNASQRLGNMRIREQFAVKAESRTYDGISLMKHAIQNTSPNITKKIQVGDEVQKVRDTEAIQLANSKIDEIRNGFSDWLREQSPEFKQRLTDQYNRKFNNSVKPQYNGSMQTFPDLDLKGLGIPGLYDSQKDAVWMLKTNGGGIIDHEVGGGKTLIMCCAAYEMKRLGLANKPLIIGLKANIHEIAQTFQTAYPNAKVLYPGKEDFSPENRVRIMREMQNNDWDAIILSHEQFGMIPQSAEIQKRILQEELDSVEENLEVLSQQGTEVSNAMLKGVEKRKTNLEARIKELTFDIENRKDDVVDFKQMGIDHLLVDESHYQNF